MRDEDAVANIAILLDSADTESAVGRIANVLRLLNSLAKLGADLRLRVARAVAELTVADEGESVSLAKFQWNWRDLISQGDGPATRQGYVQELLYKGWYAVNAARRLATADDPEKALQREHRFYQQHLAAVENRMRKRRTTDALAAEYGLILGWYSVLDGSTTPECRDAHGKNFRVNDPPEIGLPGTVHSECRCTAGPPHRDAVVMG